MAADLVRWGVTRVLVVEDSSAIRILLLQVLVNHGFAPIEAASAESAMQIAGADPPDLAIIDHHLPQLSGSDLIRMFRRSSVELLRSMPVVGMSGINGTEGDLLRVGADAFVRKPFRERELLDAIDVARVSRERSRNS